MIAAVQTEIRTDNHGNLIVERCHCDNLPIVLVTHVSCQSCAHGIGFGADLPQRKAF